MWELLFDNMTLSCIFLVLSKKFFITKTESRTFESKKTEIKTLPDKMTLICIIRKKVPNDQQQDGKNCLIFISLDYFNMTKSYAFMDDITHS